MTQHEPLHHSQLLFPSAHTSINTTLTTLKRSNFSISNRLRSIIDDARFVDRVASAYQLPSLANERCGSWYVPPSQKAGSAYFKSTDGHHGQWDFSLRRLNLHVLEIVGRNGGCIIVDSTRRGKSMPDALSKTVPIWIAVLNRLLFPNNIEAGILRTPEDVVSRSEHAQIEQRLSRFVFWLEGLQIDMDSYRAILKDMPLRPIWVTPDTSLPAPETPASRTGVHLIVLCTASGRTSTAERDSSDHYVQGAADDSESWALGLDAATFWTNREQLLTTPEDDLPELIKSLVAGSKQENPICRLVLVKPAKNIWIGNHAAAELEHAEFTHIISCSEQPNDLLLRRRCLQRYVHLSCTRGKVGSRQLRHELPKLSHIAKVLSSSSKVLITCPTGKDLAVGVTLAILCLRCNTDGTLNSIGIDGDPPVTLNKIIIKQHLSWIMLSIPDAAPSRATLQSVNAFLLGWI